MKKILLIFALLLSLVVLTACTTDQTTTTPTSNEVTEPKDQDSILESLSEAIKNSFE